MKIELKHISINDRLSEETICFSADIYVDGVKCGLATNRGHGGSTDCHADLDKRDLFKAAEAYCQTLPSTPCDLGGGRKFDIKSSLEHVIDELIYAHQNSKEKEKFQKKLTKAMQSNIVYRVPNKSFGCFGWTGKQTLAEIATLKGGKEAIQSTLDKAKKGLKSGEVILNDNLESLGIKI